MGRIAVFVGMDDHKDRVQVCVMDGDGKVLGNRWRGNDRQTVTKYMTTRSRIRGAPQVNMSGHIIGERPGRVAPGGEASSETTRPTQQTASPSPRRTFHEEIIVNPCQTSGSVIPS